MLGDQLKKLIWLDDDRNPFLNPDFLQLTTITSTLRHDLIWLKTYGQFVNWITENGLPDAICFDHDLGDVPLLKTTIEVESWFDIKENREYTGYDCAKWLVEYCLDNNKDIPDYAIQSANPVGKENIDALLKNFRKNARG